MTSSRGLQRRGQNCGPSRPKDHCKAVPAATGHEFEAPWNVRQSTRSLPANFCLRQSLTTNGDQRSMAPAECSPSKQRKTRASQIARPVRETMAELRPIRTDAHRAAACCARTIARTALSHALDRSRRQLYRHLDAERRRRMADDLAHHVAADGGPGAGRRQHRGVSGRAAGGRHRRHGGPAQAAAVHAELDGAGSGGSGRADAGWKNHANAALVADAADGIRRGAERSCLAGDYSGDRFPPELHCGHCPEFRWIQCRARHWSGAGRAGDCRRRFGHRVSAERGFRSSA